MWGSRLGCRIDPGKREQGQRLRIGECANLAHLHLLASLGGSILLSPGGQFPLSRDIVTTRSYLGLKCVLRGKPGQEVFSGRKREDY